MVRLDGNRETEKQRSGQTDGWLPTAAVTQNAADDVRSGGGSADRVAARECVALQNVFV